MKRFKIWLVILVLTLLFSVVAFADSLVSVIYADNDVRKPDTPINRAPLALALEKEGINLNLALGDNTTVDNTSAGGITVSTADPVCPPEYTLQGNVCIRQDVITPQCPDGYVFNGVDCSKNVYTNPSCGGVGLFVPTLDKCYTAPMSTFGTCKVVYRVIVTPYVIHNCGNSSPVTDFNASIDIPKNGSVIVSDSNGVKLSADSNCNITLINANVNETICSFTVNNYGFATDMSMGGLGYRTWVFKNVSAPTVGCPDGMVLQDEMCLKDPTCLEGVFDGGIDKCVSIDVVSPQCPDGYSLVDGVCSGVVTVQPQCPDGYVYDVNNNTCLQQ